MAKLLLKSLAALGAVSAAGIAAGVGTYYAGFIDVSADTPHSAMVFAVIEGARERAIARHARDITPPGDLSDAERVRRGAGNYEAMCVNCHLAPGMANSEIRRGLYPTPPDLTKAFSEGQSQDATSARQFWVIKHGIKASGMAAWSLGGMDDADIWDLTAFLRRLSALSAEQYRSLVAASGGHVHGGVDDDEHHGPHAPQHADRPGAKAHTHEDHAH